MTAEDEIRRLIAARGRITFAEFMEVALYHPDGGYYTSGERVGASGDFYTSPSVHPAFGTLLAVQLYQMWQLLEQPAPFTVIEAGAGNGLLCRDIVAAATGLPATFREALRYVCIDRRTSGGLELGLDGVSRVASDGMPLRGIVGCILANELLDAMPVHQVTSTNGELKEIFVVANDGELATHAASPSTPLLGQRLNVLGVRLEEGQVAEINLALNGWIEGASRSLERGFVLTIDYGRLAEDLYSPLERFRGTLTTFHTHLQTDRPLQHISRQDMSAQVDFTSVAGAAADAGLDVQGYISQAEFLHNLGIRHLLSRLAGTPGEQQRSAPTAMRELVKPDGMGAFRVMALARNAGRPRLWGFHPSADSSALIGQLPMPEPTPEHVDLISGRYPWHQAEFDVPWDALWPIDETEE